ncbi:hypothetical protein SteCoe_23458 [Stentor coeruleus]|uniref:ENTH domain-containing protein n=1 Tax=Stentor coeruleus TaxID=5963 RepID=A0A1R2BJX8_9CILI|nr:hypothetical protein SteCoe_23458 [Stentor coeruleus]
MEDFGFVTNSYNSTVSNQVIQATKNDNSPTNESIFHSIADISIAHPEDISTILQIIWSNLKSPAKEWRCINKTLSLLLVLVKFGNVEIVNECKQKSAGFREMMEFFYIENRLDKGGVVRDKARLLYFMLTTQGFIESEREYVRPPVQKTKAPLRQVEDNYGRRGQQIKKLESTPNLFEDHSRPVENKRVNVFEGIQVKDASKSGVIASKAQSIDLLGDFSAPNPAPSGPVIKPQFPQTASKPVVPQSNKVPDDLLLISHEPSHPIQKSGLTDLLLDLSGTISGPISTPVIEKKLEPQEQKPKILCNLGEQGPTMNAIKTTPSFSKPSPSQVPPQQMDLESKLLNFDILSKNPIEEKAKPQFRSFY